eukprot:5736047-Amphidinium_carterae.1
MAGRWRARLTQEELQSMRVLREMLSNARPRIVRDSDEVRPVLVFTDGSSEGCSHLWGAVVLDP